MIAGTLHSGGADTPGPIQGLGTEPIYFDIGLPGGGEFRHDLPQGHNAFVYLYEGVLCVGACDSQPLQRRCAGVLGAGVAVTLRAGAEGARLILLAARPLNEPVAQYGPFVMNTREELEQAVRDYQSGRLTA